MSGQIKVNEIENSNELFSPEEMQSPFEDSGEVHLSEAIRKIQIPSEKWDEQGVLMYKLY